MSMELRIEIELRSEESRYEDCLRVSREFKVGHPDVPGSHEAEVKLVEAATDLVHFGEDIGILHEELTRKYEDLLERRRQEEMEALKTQGTTTEETQAEEAEEAEKAEETEEAEETEDCQPTQEEIDGRDRPVEGHE